MSPNIWTVNRNPTRSLPLDRVPDTRSSAHAKPKISADLPKKAHLLYNPHLRPYLPFNYPQPHILISHPPTTRAPLYLLLTQSSPNHLFTPLTSQTTLTYSLRPSFTMVRLNPFRRSKRLRGEASTSTQREEPQEDFEEEPEEAQQDDGDDIIPPIGTFENITFVNWEHRTKFMELIDKRIVPTRFLSKRAMCRLNIGNEMEELLTNTGLGFLFNLRALTFVDLTLEFLCSWHMDPFNNRISFRLCNTSRELSLEEFGDIFGFEHGGLITAPGDYNPSALWYSLTGQANMNVSSIKTNAIQVPQFRIWQRLVAGTIFGRNATGVSNKTEMSVLGSYLNVQGFPHFRLNLAYLVAQHFDRVSKGHYTTIDNGGLISYIASRIIPGFTREGHRPVEPIIPLIDLDCLIKIHKWVRYSDRRYEWRVTSDRWIAIDSTAIPRAIRTPPSLPGAYFQMPMYLIPDLPDAPQRDRQGRWDEEEEEMDTGPPAQHHMEPPRAPRVQQPRVQPPPVQQTFQPPFQQPGPSQTGTQQGWGGITPYEYTMFQMQQLSMSNREAVEYNMGRQLYDEGYMRAPAPLPSYWGPDGTYLPDQGVRQFDLSNLPRMPYYGPPYPGQWQPPQDDQ